MRTVRGVVLVNVIGVAFGQGADLTAYADVAKKPPRRDAHANVALTPPRLAWDDHAGSLPPTISSTSQYKLGSSASPGAFAVNRREPWLLPARHEPHQPHPASGPETDPEIRHFVNSAAAKASWHVPIDMPSLKVTGLPRQPDWPVPAHGTQVLEGHASASTADGEPPVEPPESSAPMTEEAEWGTAPLQPTGATADEIREEAASPNSTRGGSGSGNSTAAPLTNPATLLAQQSGEDAQSSPDARSTAAGTAPTVRLGDGETPRGANWWAGEKPIRSWRLAALAAKLSTMGSARDMHGVTIPERGSAAPASSARAAATNTEEAEWQHSMPARGEASSSSEARATALRAAAAAIESGDAPAVAVGPSGMSRAGGLADGALGAVYEVKYE